MCFCQKLALEAGREFLSNTGNSIDFRNSAISRRHCSTLMQANNYANILHFHYTDCSRSLKWNETKKRLKIYDSHPLRTESRNSLLAGSAYSLTAPSLILKPSFQSFRVTSVWDSRLELEGGPITRKSYEPKRICTTSWTLNFVHEFPQPIQPNAEDILASADFAIN